MTNDIILGIETGEGKYLVFTQEDQDAILFVAFNQIGIGGHGNMRSKLEDVTSKRTIEKMDLHDFSRRPEIIRALNKAIRVSVIIPQLNFANTDSYSGGKYKFKGDVLELYDFSIDFDVPSLEVLRKLEKGLLGYTNSQGNSIKEVRLE